MRMNNLPKPLVDYAEVLQPETELEQRLLLDPDFLTGLSWGMPRYGHPEGEVYKHVREVLDNIERLPLEPAVRRQLRIITFVHDTFKYKEPKGYPRDWSRHHSILAREFLENYTDEKAVLDVTELHDEAYYCWRMEFLYQQPQQGRERLDLLFERLGENRQLYYLFFKCDTSTGDKNPAPLRWFEHTIPDIEVLRFRETNLRRIEQ
ncbi:MAG: hypothetical protein H6555_04620 [Lewinellaceae bacterium]|nr:hypothetical protein [Lewinellaceae bacterium]